MTFSQGPRDIPSQRNERWQFCRRGHQYDSNKYQICPVCHALPWMSRYVKSLRTKDSPIITKMIQDEIARQQERRGGRSRPLTYDPRRAAGHSGQESDEE